MNPATSTPELRVVNFFFSFYLCFAVDRALLGPNSPIVCFSCGISGLNVEQFTVRIVEIHSSSTSRIPKQI